MRQCVVCPARGREQPSLVEHPQACKSCRTWLPTVVADIVALWERLRAGHDDPAEEWIVQQLRDGRWHTEPGHDPVAAALPTGAPGRTPPRLGLVSGSRDPEPPVNLDHVDLTLPAHGDNLTPTGKAEWRHQIGHLSVAMELDLIARAWAEDLGHRLPPPTVPALAGWLTHRVEWACDQYPGIDADAAQLAKLRGTLRSVLGETAPRPQRMQAPCPGCDMFTLVARPGEDLVECQGPDEDCRRVLTLREYEDYAKRVLAYEREHGSDERIPA